MKTFFITGGAGFIGGNFIHHLMKTGQTKVINYDKLTYAGNLDTLVSIENNPLYTFEHGDICDANRLKKLFIFLQKVSYKCKENSQGCFTSTV